MEGKVRLSKIMGVIFFWIILPFLFEIQLTPHVMGEEENENALKKLLEAKISAASKYNQKLGEVPASVTIVTSEEIEKFGYRSLNDILMRVRGFFITDDLNYTYIGVRGISRTSDFNNRVILLINGIPMTENVFGSTLIGVGFGLDVESIDRVEIIRGPSSALYGSNAMLALINVITKNGKSEDGMNLNIQAGGLGKLQPGLQVGKEMKSGLDFFVTGNIGSIRGRDYYFKEYDDPSTNNGWAKNIDRERYHGIFTNLMYREFEIQGMISSREKRVPTASYDTVFGDPRLKTIDSQGFIELKYSRNLNFRQRIFLRGYYGSYVYYGSYPYDLPNYKALQEDRSTARWLGAEAQFSWDIGAANRLFLGSEFKSNLKFQYKYWDENEVIYDKDYPFSSLSFYLQDEHQLLRNLFLTFGIRYDKAFTGEKTLSPRAAVIFNPFASTTLKFLLGKGFRTPTFYEYYYGVESESKGNPSLKGEKIYTFETVIEQQFSRQLLGVFSWYHLKVKGEIIQMLDAEDQLLQFVNGKTFNVNGIETELNMRLGSGLMAYINYAFQKCKDVLTGEKLTNSPSHLFKAGISAPVFSRSSIAVNAINESERLTLAGTKTKSFFLINFHFFNSGLFGLSDRIQLSFFVGNVLGKKYWYPASGENLQTAFLQPGRTLSLKLIFKLSK